jgi:hypothetical protein
MTAWRMVWHLARWEAVRMRWWVLGMTALTLLLVLLALADLWDAPTITVGLLASFAPVTVAVVVAHGDSPLRATSFYRGRPIQWWGVPAAKLVTLLLVIAGPALLLSAVPMLQWNESWVARVGHLKDILVASSVASVTGMILGAVTGSMTRLGVLLVANIMIAQLVGMGLKSTEWNGSQMLVWLSLAAMFALSVDVYRRKWNRRPLIAVVLLLSILSALGTTKASRNTVVTWSPLADSVQVTIDSVSKEQPHILRVAFTVETKAPIDGIRLSEGFSTVSAPSSLFGLGRIGHASAIRLTGPSAGERLLTVTDPDGRREVSLKSGRGNGGQGRSSGDLFFDASDAQGVRRARAVAIVVLWDTIVPLAYTVSVQGRVIGFRGHSEGILPLDTTVTAGTGMARWRLRRRPSADESGWLLERKALGSAKLDTLNAPLSEGHYATRFIVNGRRTNSGLTLTGARSTYNVPIVTGLNRSVETVSVAGWALERANADTVELLRLEALKKFDMYTSVTISRSTVRAP